MIGCKHSHFVDNKIHLLLWEALSLQEHMPKEKIIFFPMIAVLCCFLDHVSNLVFLVFFNYHFVNVFVDFVSLITFVCKFVFVLFCFGGRSYLAFYFLTAVFLFCCLRFFFLFLLL